MNRGVEPDTRKFLFKIVNSISFGLLWMIVNVFTGIYLGLGVVENAVTATNIIFYIWFVVSIVLLLWILRRIWRK